MATWKHQKTCKINNVEVQRLSKDCSFCCLVCVCRTWLMVTRIIGSKDKFVLLTPTWVEAATAPMCNNTGYFSKEEQQLLERSSLSLFTASVVQRQHRGRSKQDRPEDWSWWGFEFFSAYDVEKQRSAEVSCKQHPLFFREATPTSVYPEAISYFSWCCA